MNDTPDWDALIEQYSRELMRTHLLQELTSQDVPVSAPDEPAWEPPQAEADPVVEIAETEPPAAEEVALPPDKPPLDTEDAYLQVIVTTAQGAVPIQGATVIVTRNDNGTPQLLRVLTTDVSGRTPVITLPAVKAAYSQSPDTPDPFTLYGVEVTYPAYYRAEAVAVPLFGGVTSLQPIRLIPLPDGYQGNGVLSSVRDAALPLQQEV